MFYIRDSKSTATKREILNCSRSLANNALHPSSQKDCQMSLFPPPLSPSIQAYIDACSTSEMKYNKNTPSAKLLYVNEVRSYKQEVQQ